MVVISVVWDNVIRHVIWHVVLLAVIIVLFHVREGVTKLALEAVLEDAREVL